MFRRCRFKQKQSLEQRLSEEAEKLRKEAQNVSPGVERNS